MNIIPDGDKMSNHFRTLFRDNITHLTLSIQVEFFQLYCKTVKNMYLKAVISNMSKQNVFKKLLCITIVWVLLLVIFCKVQTVSMVFIEGFERKFNCVVCTCVEHALGHPLGLTNLPLRPVDL